MSAQSDPAQPARRRRPRRLRARRPVRRLPRDRPRVRRAARAQAGTRRAVGRRATRRSSWCTPSRSRPRSRASDTGRGPSSSSARAGAWACSPRAAGTRSSTSPAAASWRRCWRAWRRSCASASRPTRRAAAGCAPTTPGGVGQLRAVDLREVRDDDVSRVLVTFVVQRDRVRDLAPLRDAAEALMQALPEVAGVAVNFHEGDAPQILGGETLPLAGASSAPDRLGSSVHLATFGSFVQAHRGQAARVHSMLAEALGVPGASAGRPRDPRSVRRLRGDGARARGDGRAGALGRVVRAGGGARARGGRVAEAGRRDGVRGRGQRAPLRRRETRALRRGRGQPTPARGEPAGARSGSRASSRRSSRTCRAIRRRSRATSTTSRASATRQPRSRPLDMIPLTDEVETVAVLRRAGVPVPARPLRGQRDPRRRQGPARADDAAGRVRGLAAGARAAACRGRRTRCRCSGSTSGRAAW